ncbi:MAG: polysaccharide biosynthesis protein [Bacilli bacterium]|nr:polysaccharide biosynthesis protein [Bacilli bacterium]
MGKLMENNNIKKIVLFVYDLCTLILAYIFTVMITHPLANFKDIFFGNLTFGIISIVTSILIYIIFKLYNSLWRYASITEILRIVASSLLVCLMNLTIYVFNHEAILPKAAIVFMFLQFGFGMIPRFSYRIFHYLKKDSLFTRKDKLNGKDRAMIVGAGDAGVALIREMMNSEVLNLLPLCIIDDDENKIKTYINNIPVVGGRDDIPYYASKYDIDVIIIAIPSADNKDVTEIINICKDTKCKIKLLPGTLNVLSGGKLLSSMRDVEVSDLLGREQVKVNLDEILGYIEEKIVMVTGGSGSIGSEICRQIASHKPKQLIVFDIYENSTYELELELKSKFPEINMISLIGSVRDKIKLEEVFRDYKPNIVFHAAAHKHVPLMETSPNEAVKNNVFGTLNCCRMADKYKADKFILISTDKAVNPTSTMGATKRICEMIIQSMNEISEHTEFVAVRFGNVLGSNGSVIPLFKKQIAAGGPVTVTDKNIVRYFMTIPEAVSLVLQAGAYAKGGEIFVLDMGKPVKIYDLAVNLIKLSGYTPNVDMKIEIVGLRPGEKLYEELLMDEEGLQKTQNDLIYIGKPLTFDRDEFFKSLDELYNDAYNEIGDMKEHIAKIVTTYHITENKHN